MIIYLHGADTFRSRKKLKAIKEKFQREVDQNGMNLELLDGAAIDSAELQRAISTAPFLAAKRMVVIQQLIKNKKGDIHAAALELFEKTGEHVIIVLWEEEIAPGDVRSGDKKKLATFLAKQKFAQEFKLLSQPQLIDWVRAECSIATEAAKLLVEYVGNNLWQLSQELQKLKAYAGSEEITSEMVKNLVRSPLEDNVFALTDAVGSRNHARALQLINEQLETGVHPVELLGKLAWQWRNLLLIKSALLQPHISQQQLSKQLGLHPFVIQKSSSMANRYSLDELQRIYRELLEIDLKIKTSQADPQVLFDLLVVRS